MSLATAPSIVIKVPVHAGKPRAAPPVAARLKARSFPARHGASPEVRPETLTESWHPRGVMPSIVPLLPSLSMSALVAPRATTPSTRVSLPPENARARAVAPARPRSRFVDNAANNDTTSSLPAGGRAQGAHRRLAQGARQRQRRRAQRARLRRPRRRGARRVAGHAVQALLHRPTPGGAFPTTLVPFPRVDFSTHRRDCDSHPTSSVSKNRAAPRKKRVTYI